MTEKKAPDTSPGPALTGTEAIILAGGLGTRLREAVPDLPKCMAPVAGRPFLFYVINHLRLQGITRFIFSLGYKHEIIEQYLQDHFPSLDYQCAIESGPLGTGGAIRLACQHASGEQVIVTNGDTLFKTDLAPLVALHLQLNAACTLALKPMKNMERYGVVELKENRQIHSFREKQFYSSGLINGGLYVVNREYFLSLPFPPVFSFETEFLQQQVAEDRIAGLAEDAYFIDIGIPEDYNRAQEELRTPPLDLRKIDKTWTLFLDRDGVINEDKPGSYIFTPEEFVFMKEVPGIFPVLGNRFSHIIVVTNQRGVGKGLMTEGTLRQIHDKMQAEIEKTGAKIDAIYYAPGLHNTDPLRKPNPGMALLAAHDFAGIALHKSIMVGNNISDMQFGRNAGMYTVFLTTTNPNIQLPHPDIDLLFASLADFAKAL